MANPLPNHVVNLPDDEQVQPEPAPALLGFVPAILDIPNNNNCWMEEDPEEDPEIEEEEEEEIEIEDEMNDPEIINPLSEMDRYLGGIGMERRSETREHYELKQSVSTLDDQMRGLMLEDKEEKERIMPPKAMSQAAIERLITQRVNVALEAERASQANAGGKEAMQMEQEAKIGHLHISECTERNKVKFVAATLQGRALTWWNSQVATLGLEVTNLKSWGDMKKMMMEEVCPDEEVQMLEDELRSLKLRDTNTDTYTQRFNELVLICAKVVPSEKKKAEAYIRGLPKNIKGEVTSSRPVNLNETVHLAHTLMEQKIQAKAERIAERNKRK
nr:hypothetical protein [Tanacetum cinerariifolium]